MVAQKVHRAPLWALLLPLVGLLIACQNDSALPVDAGTDGAALADGARETGPVVDAAAGDAAVVADAAALDGSSDGAAQDASLADGAVQDTSLVDAAATFVCGPGLRCRVGLDFCEEFIPGAVPASPQSDRAPLPVNSYSCKALPQNCADCSCLQSAGLPPGCLSCRAIAAGQLWVSCPAP
ncbi:MAG: hypothetical protein H6707_10680 [Deltaproteobacteria bacterium]|nr:hypothetical protein [Deltaproteobacteria bacterium]